MTTQIAVRLPDDVVAFLDRCVASGDSPSRAALVTSALEREMRRRTALADVDMLARRVADDDLDDLVTWSTGHPHIEDRAVREFCLGQVDKTRPG